MNIKKESAWIHQKDKDERTEFNISEDKFADPMNIFGEYLLFKSCINFLH